MSSQARVSKSPAQTRLAGVIASYVQYLMDAQAASGVETPVDGAALPPPNSKYPSHDYFCATHTPPISVEKYTDRLVTYMHCSSEVYVFAAAYLRRLALSGFPMHMRSIHRLLLTAVLVALKCRDDIYYHMGFYAEVGGVTPKDLCSMEIHFLCDLIHFEGEVSTEEYHTVMEDITRATQRRLLMKSMSNESELSSQCGVSTGDSTASTPGDIGCLHEKSVASAHSWTSECELYAGC
ncbi:CYC2-like protein [Novymonas esmeraldas]|uniref:CYC2-like protein n=1 Tax=Novymonas esmeraldas TaxID=1808958 RepID=A0AAW0EQI2_9TRYP